MYGSPMHKATWWLLGISMVVGIIAMVLGGSGFVSMLESLEETEKIWEGEGPTTVEMQMESKYTYIVFSKENGHVSQVTVDGGARGDEPDINSCVDWMDDDDTFCGKKDGMYPIAYINIYDEGEYNITVNTSGNVTVHRFTFDIGAAEDIGVAFMLCMGSCCLGLIGFITIFALKNKVQMAGTGNMVMVQNPDGTMSMQQMGMQPVTVPIAETEQVLRVHEEPVENEAPPSTVVSGPRLDPD